jgi:predicted transcriptional regulator
MGKPVKFASQLDEEVLEDLRRYAQETDRSISGIVSEAVAEYLSRVRLRPAFRDAVEKVLDENDELLRRLAK